MWSAMCSANVTNATGTNANATCATPIGVITCAVSPFAAAATLIASLTSPLTNSLIASTKAILG